MKLFEFIPFEIFALALMNNVLTSLLKGFYFRIMAGVNEALTKEILQIIVFLLGMGMYAITAQTGLFAFSLIPCLAAPIVSIIFYRAGFYDWLVDTFKAALTAISAKLVEVINAFRHKG